MNHLANSNFFSVKLNNPAWFMLFFLVLCSASMLEHFEAISLQEAAPLVSSGVGSYAAHILQRDLKGAIDVCSEYCYNSKYFCDLFVVSRFDTIHGCTLYNTRATNFPTFIISQKFETVAVYRLFERDDIEALENRFSYDQKTSLDETVKNIHTGYFLSSSNVPTNVVTCSVKAMHQPTTAVDFDKWVISKDVSQSRREPFEFPDFTETVKTWQQFINGNNVVPTEYFDVLLLTFLDIFCPCLQQGITTIYDPVKKIIFITKEDLHILIVSYGPGDFAIVQRKDSYQSRNDPVLFFSDPVRLERNTPGNAMELFGQATGKFFSSPSYALVPGSSEYRRITPLLILNIVTLYLCADYPPNLKRFPLTGPLIVFYRDLITAVVSSVYGEPIFTNLKTLQSKNLFGDVSISTLPQE